MAKTETAAEKAARRWHVHPETGVPHNKFTHGMVDCTIEEQTNPEKFLLSQGTVWRVARTNGEPFTGKLRSIANGVLRFDTKDDEVVEITVDAISEMKTSTAKIA